MNIIYIQSKGAHSTEILLYISFRFNS